MKEEKPRLTTGLFYYRHRQETENRVVILPCPFRDVVAESQRNIGGTPDRRGIPAATICQAKYRSLTFGKANA